MSIKGILKYLILRIGSFCHRKEDRSFETEEHQSIVCLRCSSIYIGFLMTFLFLLVYGFYSVKINLLYSILLVAPISVDGLTQRAGLRESNNYFRIITGLSLGSAFALFIGKSLQVNFNFLHSVKVTLPNLPFLGLIFVSFLILVGVWKKTTPKSIYLIDGLVVVGYVSLWMSLAVALLKLFVDYLVYI